MKSKRLFLQIGLIVILAFLLSACGGATPAPTEEPAPATKAPAAPTAAPPPTEAPPVENVVTLLFPRIPGELDPSQVQSDENNMLWNVYGNLTYWDPDEGVMPYMAESWETNEDATEWTFHLREGMKCHDGSDFTAEDVKFSYERTMQTGGLAYIFDSIKEIEVVDDLTLKLILEYPYPWDANAGNSWGTYVMCESAADKPPEWFAEGNEAGAGPYRIESLEPGQNLVLTKFEDWLGEWPEGHFTKVVFQFVEDAAVREQMMLGGEGDLTREIPYDDFDSLNASGEVTAFPILTFTQEQAHFNIRRPPLDDVRVRQALSYAFPYEQAQMGAYGGFTTVAAGAVTRLMWDPPVKTTIYHYDLDKARELLEEAGVPEGTKLSIGVRVGNVEQIAMAQMWQAELAKLGIDLVLNPITGSAMWDEGSNPDTEFNIMAFHHLIGFPSPSEFLLLFDGEATWFPFAGWNNPEYNALVQEALSLEGVDKAESDRLYQEAEQIFFDNAIAVTILDTALDWAVRNDLKGLTPNPLYGNAPFFWMMYRE